MADQTPFSNTCAADHGNYCRTLYLLLPRLEPFGDGRRTGVSGIRWLHCDAFFQHAWIYAALLFGFAVLVFLAIMFAEAVSLGLEALTGKLSKFIFS